MTAEEGMAMGLGTVQARGQVTIPAAVRKAAGIKPGDVVLARATGAGRIELRLLKRVSLEQLWARFEGPGVVDDQAIQEAMAQAIAEHVRSAGRHPEAPPRVAGR